MDPCMQRALMFVGAVIGAGFASGREIVSFFSIYGKFSWGLILLSVITMALLCGVCLVRARNTDGCRWCAIYRTDSLLVRNLAEGCILLLQILMGGAMLSASGHLFALALPFRGAYLSGILVTIGLGITLARVNLKPMTVLSSLLMLFFVGAIIALLIFDHGMVQTVSSVPADIRQTLPGILRVVAYAAMNLAIAIGMICRCSDCSCRSSYRSALLFGLLMTGLLFVSNYLYLQHPELMNATFPMVVLLSRFGRTGHWMSLLMMYLAILTTLSAGLYALRTGLEARLSQRGAFWLTIFAPLAVSFAGFESIVERWYAPAGILCLLLVFFPLLMKQKIKS